MSACVLPIGPDFQDPPASPNYAPMILLADPPIGTVVTPPAGTDTTFSITVTDPNVGDDLHVRFIADYPPFTTDTRVLQSDLLVPHRADGMPLNQVVMQQVGCVSSTLSQLSSHQIMAIVADRDFVASPPPPATVNLGAIPSDGLEVEAVWILDLECP